MEILKLQEKVLSLSDDQINSIYSLASRVSQESIDELAPVLLDICLEAESGVLKNELGRVIFHLQKTERLNTRIGFEKLMHGALRVDVKEVFNLLESGASDARALVERIKSIL
ncbi:MAG TPA: hypothetical protein VMV43_03345 [Candidatus Nanopelagicaceae bacterium]|jgi:hypothetical protein|nr:hypothetical protein [Candidatus Nanopelagicaceae bacterium]